MDELPFNFDVQFLEYVKEQKDAVDALILRGQCTNHEEYVRLTSRRYGLELAEAHFKKLVTLWNNR